MRVSLMTVLMVLLTAAAVRGADPDVYIGGFVSQGYLNTEDNDYLIPDASDGSGAFTEAAVIITAEPLDRLRVGIQLLGRDFGSDEASAVMVDWAYGDYRWRDQLGFRAGRIKLPYGLYNQARDVDMLRTSVLLPQSVYSENDRNLLIAYEGIGLYGNLLLGGLGDLDYELSFGSLSVPEEGHLDTVWQFEQAGMAASDAVAGAVAEQYGVPADSVSAALDRTDDVSMAVPWILGGALIWNTPLPGLRVGITYMEGDVEVAADLHYDVLVGQGTGVPAYLPMRMHTELDLDLRHVSTGSLEYHRDALTLTTEYSRIKMGEIRGLGWYALADYRFSHRFAAQTYWSSYYPDWDDRDGDAWVAMGQPDYYAWQHDLALAVRFDISDYWLIKFEYHHMEGAALAYRSELDDDETASEHWRVWTAKTTFHF